MSGFATKALCVDQQYSTLWLVGGHDANPSYDPLRSRTITNVDLRVLGGAEIAKNVIVSANVTAKWFIGNICSKLILVDELSDKSGNGVLVTANVIIEAPYTLDVETLKTELITNRSSETDIMIMPEGNVIICSSDVGKAYVCMDMNVAGNIDVPKIQHNNGPNSGTIFVEGDLLPSANVLYNLGDMTHKWKTIVTDDLIVCGNTNIGGGGGGWVGKAESDLNMACYEIANVMALHVGNLYGKSPIDVHDNFNMKDTVSGGKITWEAGIEMGDINTVTNYSNSIAIGKNAVTTYDNTISIGHNSQSYYKGISIGYNVESTYGYAICVGYNSRAYGYYSVCMGNNNNAYGYQSVVIGTNLTTNANSDSYYNVVVGCNNFSKTPYMYGYNVIIGYGIGNRDRFKPNYANPYSSVLIGKWVGQFSYYGMGGHNVGIGSYAFQYQGYYYYGGYFNIAIGYNAQRRGTSGNFNVAIGNNALGAVVNTYKYAGYMVGVGSYAGYCLDSYGSIAIGSNSMGTVFNSRDYLLESKYVLAIGYNAMRNIITGADYNTAIGHFAMGKSSGQDYDFNKTTGTNNICIGFRSGRNISSQNRNIFIGNNAGVFVVGGNDCVSIGHQSYYSFFGNGDKSVSVGSRASASNEGIAIGYSSFTKISGVAIGYQADSTSSYGPPNFYYSVYSGGVAIGNEAKSKAFRSVVIGPKAKSKLVSDAPSGQTADNSIAIGYNAYAAHDNSIALGPNITTTYNGGFFVKHRAPVASASTAAWIGNELVDTVSSARYKDNIQTLEPIHEKFALLRPVRYNPKEGFGDTQENLIGFIAEELSEIFPEVVVYENDKTTPKSVMYDKMVALAIKEIQTLEQTIDLLQNKANAQETIIQQQNTLISSLQNDINSLIIRINKLESNAI